MTAVSEALGRIDDSVAAGVGGAGDVPIGYKSTEVGVIPKDWCVYQLDSLGTGQKPPVKAGPFGSSLTKAMYVSSGYKVYGQEQVIRGDPKYGDYYIARKTYLDLEACAVHPGDILMSLVGTVGKLLIVPKNAEPGIINPRLLRFSFDRNRIFPLFFRFLFESEHSQLLLSRSMQGGTMGILNAGILRSVKVLVPPFAEQLAIAEALSDVNNLLESLDALIAKKRAIKQAATQQLLTGKTRLPGFSGSWESKRLGDLAIFLKGSGLSKSDLSLNGRRRCIHYGELFTTYGERITNVLHGTNREGNYPVCGSNDVLMPTSDVTPNGLATASCILLPHTLIGGDILVIRTSTNVLNGVFLAYAIKVHRSQVMQLVSGTTVFHLYSRDMATFEFLSPSVKEQDAIVAVLSEMDDEIAALEQRRNKTKAIKQGMMQQLLTGRVRLI